MSGPILTAPGRSARVLEDGPHLRVVLPVVAEPAAERRLATGRSRRELDRLLADRRRHLDCRTGRSAEEVVLAAVLRALRHSEPAVRERVGGCAELPRFVRPARDCAERVHRGDAGTEVGAGVLDQVLAADAARGAGCTRTPPLRAPGTSARARRGAALHLLGLRRCGRRSGDRWRVPCLVGSGRPPGPETHLSLEFAETWAAADGSASGSRRSVRNRSHAASLSQTPMIRNPSSVGPAAWRRAPRHIARERLRRAVMLPARRHVLDEGVRHGAPIRPSG